MCFRPVHGAHRLGRHLRMVVEAEIVAGEQAGQFLGPYLAMLVHGHRRVARPGDVAEHRGQIIHGIQKQAFHRSLLTQNRRTLCNDDAVWSKREHTVASRGHSDPI